MADFPSGVQAQIHSLRGEPALNGQACVSLGASVSSGRVQVRLAGGRELAVKADNLVLSGPAGALPLGSRVVLVGLAKAPTLNGREGSITGLGEAGSGRLLVDLGESDGQAKALKAENLVLVAAKATGPCNEAGGEAEAESKAFVSEKERAARREKTAAAKACPIGSRVRIHGLVEEKGRDNSGDPALNGQEGLVENADPDEPGRLIVKLPDRVASKECKLKSLCYKNLTWLDAPPDSKDCTTLLKRSALEGPDGSTGALQVVGANGKRCKITEIAVASGDKTVAFASAARKRSLDPPTSESAQDGGVSRQNALIYARTDALSPDDDVAGAALARLAQLCPDFTMKAVCVLGVDVLANGSGKIGSKTAETLEALAMWLTGGEADGILRKRLEAAQACAGEPDALAACRRCVEKGLKGDRLLNLLRKKPTTGLLEFVSRGCKER